VSPRLLSTFSATSSKIRPSPQLRLPIRWSYHALRFSLYQPDGQVLTAETTLAVRRGINEMGVEKLLKGSSYGLATVQIWLREHDVHSCTAMAMTHTIRGSTLNEHALNEQREKFVRKYTPQLGSRGFPTRLSVPVTSMDANVHPDDVDAEAGFTPDLQIWLSGPNEHANSPEPKSSAPESPEYSGPTLEFPPTPPMA
jgi:hypothetical protein